MSHNVSKLQLVLDCWAFNRRRCAMTAGQIRPNETAFTLSLTRPEMKILYTVMKTYYDDLGHEEGDLEEIVKSILAKLPSEAEIRSIDLKRQR
jgi:hypothetical protein